MLKMDEIDQTKLPDQTKFRLNEMRKIENYFREEINQRKLCSKKVNKYVIAFKHKHKHVILIVLNATTGGFVLFFMQVLFELL